MQKNLKIATFFASIFVVVVFMVKYFYTTEKTFASPHVLTEEEIQSEYGIDEPVADNTANEEESTETTKKKEIVTIDSSLMEAFNYNAPVRDIDTKSLKQNTNKKPNYSNYEDRVRMSSPSQLDSNGLYVALMQAVGDNDVERAKALIKRGAKLNSPDGDTSYAPIFWAISNGNVEMTELLLKSGVKVNTPDEKGMFPIHYIVENSAARPNAYQMKAIFDLLLDAHPNEINRQDAVLKQTPIMLALNLNDKKAFAYLLDKGANITLVDEGERDIIDLCLENSCSTCITLIDNKKAINETSPLPNFASTFTAPDPVWLPYATEVKTPKKKSKAKDDFAVIIQGDSLEIPTYKEMPNILPLEQNQEPDMVVGY